jgi:hypothetical protein
MKADVTPQQIHSISAPGRASRLGVNRSRLPHRATRDNEQHYVKQNSNAHRPWPVKRATGLHRPGLLGYLAGCYHATSFRGPQAWLGHVKVSRTRTAKPTPISKAWAQGTEALLGPALQPGGLSQFKTICSRLPATHAQWSGGLSVPRPIVNADTRIGRPLSSI